MNFNGYAGLLVSHPGGQSVASVSNRYHGKKYDCEKTHYGQNDVIEW